METLKNKGQTLHYEGRRSIECHYANYDNLISIVCKRLKPSFARSKILKNKGETLSTCKKL